MPLRVQKLATPKMAAKKKAPLPPKPKQDDFFAEMGLSAKPTFSHTAPVQAAPRSAPVASSQWQQPVASNSTTAPATYAADLTADAGGTDDWDDDGDLDDLFDD